MKIQVELQEGDYGTPIEFANAIINWHLLKDRCDGCVSDDIYKASQESLAEIAEHIQTYLKYNSVGVLR